jgi:hypothetical protein
MNQGVESDELPELGRWRPSLPLSPSQPFPDTVRSRKRVCASPALGGAEKGPNARFCRDGARSATRAEGPVGGSNRTLGGGPAGLDDGGSHTSGGGKPFVADSVAGGCDDN